MNTESRAEEEAQLRRARRRTWPALVFAIIFVVAWTTFVGLSTIADPELTGATWYRFGVVFGGLGVIGLIFSAIAWVGLQIFLALRRSPAHGPRNLAVIMASAAAVALAFATIASLGAGRNALNLQPAEYQVAVIIDDYSLAIFDANARVELRLTQLFGSNGLLETHLHGPSSLPDLRQRIQSARAAVEQQNADIDTARSQARQQVQAADLSAVERAQASASFEAGFASTRAFDAQRTTLHDQYFDALDGLVDTLDNTGGAWRMRNGNIEFDRAEDHAAFRRAAEEVDRVAAEMEALNQQIDAQNRVADENNPLMRTTP